MLDFLKIIFNSTEMRDLDEIMDFSLNPDASLKELEEKLIFSNYHQSKLTKILLKLKMLHADLITEFEYWQSTQIHEIAFEYDGIPDLLKDKKDYEREIKKHPDYKETRTNLRKIEEVISVLLLKDKELHQVQWIIGRVYDIQKLRLGIQY